MRIAISKQDHAAADAQRYFGQLQRRQQWRPKNMKTSSSTKAIVHSRSTMRGRRCGSTPRSAVTKIGTLPKGSVTSSSRMNVWRKLSVIADGSRVSPPHVRRTDPGARCWPRIKKARAIDSGFRQCAARLMRRLPFFIQAASWCGRRPS